MNGQQLLDMEVIRVDGQTQPRQAIDETAVADYAAEMERGERFPPIDVIFDGENFWLCDGFHRWHAARRLGKTRILAVVVRGTRQDAQWKAYGANIKHGLRRTNADKQRAVKLALAHPKAANLSNIQLAKHVGVHETTILRWRDRLGRKNVHAQGGLQSRETALKPLHHKGRENRPSDDSDAIPMLDPAEAEAAELVERLRAMDYPDGQIGIIGKTKPRPLRDAIGKILNAAKTTSAPNPMTDEAGNEIPAALRPDFERRREVTQYMSRISDVKSKVLKAQAANDPLYRDLNPSQFKAECENVYRSLRAARPYAICPYCGGDGCKACCDRGWVGEFVYDAAPPEMKSEPDERRTGP